MDTEELVAAAETLEADEIAELAPDLPQEVMDDVFQSLPVEEREQLRAAMSFDDDMVGALMDFEDVTVRPDVSLEVVLRYLRRFDELPSQTDQLFVVDREETLLGVLPVNRLLVTDPTMTVGEVMQPPVVKLIQHEKAGEAAHAFERYDLVSAPVVDTNDKLVGRVTVDEILDFVRHRSQEEMLAQAGLQQEEDVFASVWASFKNRWAWLAINLVTAFIASRVIGAFEGSIEKLVALAALMPIVAGIGGNSGNQTITMIVRAAALGQVSFASAKQLIRKELTVSLINGLVWGGVMGLVAGLLYKDVALGLVMVLAMTLNLILAALMGVSIPMAMLKLGRDPAVGSSVLITAVTDSGGFFIFSDWPRFFCFSGVVPPAGINPHASLLAFAPTTPLENRNDSGHSRSCRVAFCNRQSFALISSRPVIRARHCPAEYHCDARVPLGCHGAGCTTSFKRQATRFLPNIASDPVAGLPQPDLIAALPRLRRYARVLTGRSPSRR
jgi:magnesium transporter